MGPLALAAIGAAGGLAKSEFIDRPREERQRKQAAEIARWSPWTGMKPNDITEADPFGNALQGGMTGAMLGQAMGGAEGAPAVSQAAVPQPGMMAPQSPGYSQFMQPFGPQPQSWNGVR